jgi:hypothetical protein
LGEWAPDEKAFLSMAYKNGMPPSQANSIKKLVNNSSMVIKNDGEITYKFGEVGGDFSYESTPRTDGCFDLDITQLGYFKACVENGMLAMHSNKDGGVEYYTRIY